MRQVGYLATIRLDSGRSVCLDSFEMRMTYADLVEGAPTPDLTDEHIERLRRKLSQRYRHWPVHIIEPAREDRNRPGRPEDEVRLMPSVECVGFFDSQPIGPAADPEFGVSSLVIAWFQHEPIFPVSPDALPAFAAVPWESLARDGVA